MNIALNPEQRQQKSFNYVVEERVLDFFMFSTMNRILNVVM